ncbi:MAG: SusC/RagA family TonB-linked outer membrane protein [Flavobacteriaceae bacterium]
MKLSVLLVIATFFTLQANTSYGQFTKITLNLDNVSLEQLFNEIEKSTEFRFVYRIGDLDLKRTLSLKVKEERVTHVIQRIFKGTNITIDVRDRLIYLVRDKVSVVVPKTGPKKPKEQQVVSGKIVEESGMPLPGASIVEKGTLNGTMADFEGNFSLSVSNLPVVIEVSFMGFKNREVTLESTEPMDIVLEEAANLMDEVIVTALGMKRQEKVMGYAQQTLDSKILSEAPSTNWSSGLQGKVAGLNIISGGTGPINSQNIQLRGATSLDPGGNNALIVIDGVAMNQEATAYGDNVGAAYGTEAPVDYGNAVSELNQNDIESVTVLKGPSAAALYGSRAANGVLIITTKSGKSNHKLGVSYSSTATFDEIINWPNYQYEYGAGGIGRLNTDGDFYYSFGDSADGPSTNTPEAFGPKFNGQYYYQYDPLTQSQGTERTLWRPYKNNMKDFYRTGLTLENSISIQGGDSKGSMRANITHIKNDYITPNSGFTKNSASFNGNYQISEKIKISSVVNYNNRESENLPAFGISNGSLGYAMMFLMPSVDMQWYKPIWQNGKENLEQLNPFSNWSSNPYYLMYVDTNPISSNQIIGNIKTEVTLTDHLDFMGRISMNSLAQLRETHRGYSSKKHPLGYYGRQDISSQEINSDFLFTYKNKFSDVLDYNLTAGGSHMSYVHRNVMSSVDALIVPSVYTLSNGVNNPLVKTNDSEKQINSFYGLLSLGFKDLIFLDFTGRNDWSSTLPKEHNSFFYPSVSSSFILSDMFDFPDKVTYLKYRLSYAKVGSDADPYQTSKYYSQSGFPSSATVPATMFNQRLKPEITSSWETGIDYRMFNNRLGIDLTLYTANTDNQILVLPNDIVSGYSNRVINAGLVKNRGVEIVLNGTPIRTNDFEWKLTGNWSTNDNEIMELTDNMEQQTLTTVWQSSLIATVGGSTSDVWGTKFVRDPEGNKVYKNGVPVRTSSKEYIGNTAPDWKAGLTNTLTYNNLRLSFTFDGQYGGLIYSGTYNRSSWAGTLANTLPGRDEGVIIGEGVVQNNDGSYSPNTEPINTQTYYGQYHQVAEAGVFDSSFLKFREISLGYSFPKSVTNNLNIANLSLSVFGRNLAIFDNYPMTDPEAGTRNGTVFVPGLEMTPMPYTASFGANLKIDF